MFSHWQRASGIEAREYEQIRATRDQTIDSWQLEDALNALKQTESLIASLENNHARESEQLHTAIAALEHTTRQRQTEVEQLEDKLRRRKEQTEQQLAAAHLSLKKTQAAKAREARQYAAENNKLRGLVQASKRHILSQKTALADLDHLCDRREAEIADANQTIEELRAEIEAINQRTAKDSAAFQETITKQQRQLEDQDRAISTLKAENEEKDSELIDALRLCDDTDIKFTHAAQTHGREVAQLQLTINRLQDTLREQQTRSSDLQQQRDDLKEQRDDLEQQLSVRLTDLKEQSQQKIDEAQQRYQSQFGNMKAKIDDLESLVGDRASQVQQLTATLVQLKDRHANEIASTQDSANETVKTVVSEHQAEMQKLSSAISRLKQEHEKEIAATRASADEALAMTKSQHQAEVQRLQSVMGSLEKAFQANISEKRNVQAKADQLQQQCESLKKNSDEKQVDRAAQIKKLEESIRQGQERIKAQKLKEAKQLRIELEELKRMLAATQQNTAHFEKEARRLSRRLSERLTHHVHLRDHLYQRIRDLQSQLQQLRGSERAA